MVAIGGVGSDGDGRRTPIHDRKYELELRITGHAHDHALVVRARTV
jgi:hypothetical protein